MWNYLRVRGEYGASYSNAGLDVELPLRARRILEQVAETALANGTTSAHAENTLGLGHQFAHRWNYLRTRGEYFGHDDMHVFNTELPPHTRRIR